jgi:hypothetical protein
MRTALYAVLIIALGADAAGAQSSAWTDRAYVTVNGGVKATPSTFTGTEHPIAFVEAATVDTSYKVKSAPEFDVAGGVRVWRNLAIGADVSRFSKKDGADVQAQVPHPLYFGRPRSVSGNAGGLSRMETALHVQAVWVVPMADRWQLAIAGGPSMFNVAQDLVEDVTIDQSYPFDTAKFSGIVSKKQTRTGVGFNAGADITRLLSRHVGIGAAVSFSRARVNMPSATDSSLKVDAGGANVGGGIRLRF